MAAGINGPASGLGSLAMLSGARSRAVSAENPTGAEGQGGAATDGTGADLARDLGRGWKISPSVRVPPRASVVLADIEGPGVIQHMWLTVENPLVRRRFGMYRWHIPDPIRFQRGIRVTVQSLGLLEGTRPRYVPTQDDVASTAIWYQREPHAPFLALPGPDGLTP